MKQILSRMLPFRKCGTEGQIVYNLINVKPPAHRDEVADSDTPDVVDNDMWELMNSCWSFKPQARPLCDQICQRLGLGGLSNTEPEDEAQAQYLQAVVGKNSDFKIDMVKVSEILAEVGHLVTSTNFVFLTFGA